MAAEPTMRVSADIIEWGRRRFGHDKPQNDLRRILDAARARNFTAADILRGSSNDSSAPRGVKAGKSVRLPEYQDCPTLMPHIDRDTHCTRCGRVMPRGVSAWVYRPEDTGRMEMDCVDCRQLAQYALRMTGRLTYPPRNWWQTS